MGVFLINRLLLILLATYTLVASLCVGLSIEPHFDFYIYHYLLVLACIWITALLSLKGFSFSISSSDRKWLAISFAIGSIIWWIYRKPMLFKGPIWFDEVTQFLNNFSGNLILHAAQQQHPPIDYFLSKFAALTLGISETALLSHALLFGVLSYCVFGLWMVAARLPLPLMALGFLYFAGQNVLLQFSSEARPISIGVCCALIYFLFLYETFQTKKIPYLALFSSGLLLLYSTGLQPMFFLPLLMLCLWPAAKIYFQNSQWLKVGAASFLFPMILFLPTLHKIYQECVISAQFHQGSHWTKWFLGIKGLSFSSFAPYVLSSGAPLFFAPLALLTLSFMSYRCGKISTFQWRLSLSSLLFASLFPLCFQIFWSTINWTNYDRYYVLWIVGLLLLCIWSAQSYFRDSKWKFASLPIALYLIWIFIPSQWHFVESAHAWRPDWRPIVRTNPMPEHNELFVDVPYLPVVPFAHGAFHHLSGQICLEKNQYMALLSHTAEKNNFLTYTPPLFRIAEPLQALKPTHPDWPWAIHFTVLKNETTPYENLLKISPMFDSFEDKGVYVVMTMGHQNSAEEAVTRVFESLILTAPDHPNNYYLLDAVLSQALKRKDKTLSKKYFELLKKVVLESAIKDDPHLPSYLEYLEKRLIEI